MIGVNNSEKLDIFFKITDGNIKPNFFSRCYADTTRINKMQHLIATESENKTSNDNQIRIKKGKPP